MEAERLTRTAARKELGIEEHAFATAVLPGSRAGEVRRLLPAMVAAVSHRPGVARVLLTQALDPGVRAWARAYAHQASLDVHEVMTDNGAPRVLAAFDVALCASGTASLEAVMANVPPVVAYRLDALAATIARRLLLTPHIALPNVLLGRRAFPELLQDEACAGQMGAALDALTSCRERALADCAFVRQLLGSNLVPSQAVAGLLTEWFHAPGLAPRWFHAPGLVPRWRS
jgi:lipid-A-disaccharide synthase